MKATILYFSQTGNTHKVARAFGEGLEERQHAVRLVPLLKATAEDLRGTDLLGVGAPCFASQAPTPVKNFLRSLPSQAGRRAFVFATSGGAPGRVLSDLARSLEAKGADVCGGSLVRGELFYPAPCVVGRFKGRPNAADLSAVRAYARALGDHIASGRQGLVPGSRPDTLKPGHGFYDFVAMMCPDSAVRMAIPEPKLDSARCDQCGWCEKACPTQSITLSPYPVAGKSCIRCLRCLTGCPQHALSEDWRFANPFLFSVYNVPFERWFGDLKPGEEPY